MYLLFLDVGAEVSDQIDEIINKVFAGRVLRVDEFNKPIFSEKHVREVAEAAYEEGRLRND